MLYVVVNSFSALDFGVERKNVSSFVFSLVFDLNAPDTLTSGSSVLLQDSLGVGKSFRESLSEIFHLVVDVGIIRNKFGLVELHEGWLGAEVDHGIRVSHADQTGGWQFSENIHKDLLSVGKRSGVDSADVSGEPVDDIVVDLFSFFIFEFDDFAVPSLFLDALDDGDGVLSEAIRTLIRASNRLEDADSLSFFKFFRCHTGTHSSTIK